MYETKLCSFELSTYVIWGISLTNLVNCAIALTRKYFEKSVVQSYYTLSQSTYVCICFMPVACSIRYSIKYVKLNKANIHTYVYELKKKETF